MSATNRGGKRSASDFYPTPGWCVHRLLEAVVLPGGAWLEPAAGEGAIIRATGAVRDDVQWRAVELEATNRAALSALVGKKRLHIGNFLDLPATPPRGGVSVVMTNPPFSLAMPMIEHAIALDARYVVMLLRLNFLASGTRAAFMRSHTPDVYVLPNRPSFSGVGTDSIEYAWFVWHGATKRRHGRLAVLATTSAKDRR